MSYSLCPPASNDVKNSGKLKAPPRSRIQLDNELVISIARGRLVPSSLMTGRQPAHMSLISLLAQLKNEVSTSSTSPGAGNRSSEEVALHAASTYHRDRKSRRRSAETSRSVEVVEK